MDKKIKQSPEELKKMAIQVISQQLQKQEWEIVWKYDKDLANARNQWELARVVYKVMKDKWLDLEELINKFIDIAENAVLVDKNWFEHSNDYVKLQALTKLAEMAWIYKQKNIEVKVNFLSKLYSDDEN